MKFIHPDEKLPLIYLRKPILVKPGSKYQICSEQSIPLNQEFCSGEFLKSKIEMKSNIIVNFHGCSPIIAPRIPSNEKLTRGIIKVFNLLTFIHKLTENNFVNEIKDNTISLLLI